jgi:hypothetical protein
MSGTTDLPPDEEIPDVEVRRKEKQDQRDTAQ